MIKFNTYNVVNTETGKKARVAYHIGNRVDGRKAVTIYAKDYGYQLGGILSHTNSTDSQTDYFETDKAVIFEDHPMYAQALKTATAVSAKYEAKREAVRQARLAKLAA